MWIFELFDFWAVWSIFILLIVLLTKKSDLRKSPFQSEQVKEITEHMTDSEATGVLLRSGLIGLFFALLFGPINCLAFFFHTKHAPLLMLQLNLASLTVVVLFIRPWMDKQAKAFLASTEWAKRQGIQPEEIQLRAFRKQK